MIFFNFFYFLYHKKVLLFLFFFRLLTHSMLIVFSLLIISASFFIVIYILQCFKYKLIFYSLLHMLYSFGYQYTKLVNRVFPYSLPMFNIMYPFFYYIKLFYIISIPLLKFIKEILKSFL